jgi:ribonuclease PH
VDGRPVLDLEYAEDVRADVDANVVMASADRFVEVQGTGENNSFSRSELDLLLDLAAAGIRTLDAAQARALAGG